MKKKHISISMIMLVTAVLTQGCSTHSRVLWAQADTHYSAVRVKDWMRPPAQGKARTIRILMVHGMGDQPFGVINNDKNKPNLLGHDTYSGLLSDMETRVPGSDAWNKMRDEAVGYEYRDFIDNASRRLGYFTQSPNHEFDLVWDRDPPHNRRVIGYVFTTTYEPARRGDVRLKFYVMNWCIAGVTAKERRFGSFGLLDPHPHEGAEYIAGDVGDFESYLNANRQMLNKYLKLHVMDWGLGDAVLYLGDTGNNYRRVVATQLKKLLGEAWEAGPNDRLAILADSLGSTIALDTIQDLVHERDPKMMAFFQTAKNEADPQRARDPKHDGIYAHARATFYMFANQYGLLKLGPSSRRSNPGDLFVKLNNDLMDPSRTNLQQEKAVFQIYAFTDPNDLLSYPLNVQGPAMSSCNVYVHNSGFNLGIIAEPGEVHVNYEKNRAVIDAVLNGPKDVKLPPK